MKDNNTPDGPHAPGWMRAGLLAFGLFVMAFLIAIDRPHWFHVKPLTGTALAMSASSASDVQPEGKSTPE